MAFSTNSTITTELGSIMLSELINLMNNNIELPKIVCLDSNDNLTVDEIDNITVSESLSDGIQVFSNSDSLIATWDQKLFIPNTGFVLVSQLNTHNFIKKLINYNISTEPITGFELSEVSPVSIKLKTYDNFFVNKFLVNS